MARVFSITGAQKTGKTTLKSRIKKLSVSDIKFPPSPGEYARQQGVAIGKAGTDETHIFFARAHTQNLIEAVNEGHDLFLDRCLIDHLAYVRLLSADSNLIEMNETLVELSATMYEAVFLTQINFDLVPVSDAHEDSDFRREVQSQIFEIASQYSFKHVILDQNLDVAQSQISKALK